MRGILPLKTGMVAPQEGSGDGHDAPSTVG